MKHDLRHLFVEVGRKMKREPQQIASDFERLSDMLGRHHIHLSSTSLKKLWEVMTGKRKLSDDALDRLALFAGFQDWHDLKEALHGDVDASINYEEERDRR